MTTIYSQTNIPMTATKKGQDKKQTVSMYTKPQVKLSPGLKRKLKNKMKNK